MQSIYVVVFYADFICVLLVHFVHLRAAFMAVNVDVLKLLCGRFVVVVKMFWECFARGEFE